MQRGQAVFPGEGIGARHHGDRGQGQQGDAPAGQRRGVRERDRDRQPRSRQALALQLGGNQNRQDPAGGHRGHGHSGQHEEPQLRHAGEAGEGHQGKHQHGAASAQGDHGPQFARGLRQACVPKVRTVAPLRMGEQVQGVVQGDPQHGDAEGQRDPVQVPEDRSDHRRRDQDAARQRYGCQPDRMRVAEHRQQQEGQGDTGAGGDPGDLATDGGPRFHRDDRRAGDLQAQLRRVEVGEGGARAFDQGRLGVQVHAVGGAAQHQQRPFSIGGDPDPVRPGRCPPAGGGELFQNDPGLGGGVARDQFPGQCRDGAGEVVAARLQVFAQGILAEGIGVDLRAQQVAMFDQEFQRRVVGVQAAVVDARHVRDILQSGDQGIAGRGPIARLAPGDRQQQHASGRAGPGIQHDAVGADRVRGKALQVGHQFAAQGQRERGQRERGQPQAQGDAGRAHQSVFP